MADRVMLTIGTKKGVFVAEAGKTRKRFDLRGPFGPGVPVYSTFVDTRGTPGIYASSCNPFFGMKVLKSTDMGKSFKEISDETGVGVNTLLSRKRYAVLHLRKRLQSLYDELAKG